MREAETDVTEDLATVVQAPDANKSYHTPTYKIPILWKCALKCQGTCVISTNTLISKRRPIAQRNVYLPRL